MKKCSGLKAFRFFAFILGAPPARPYIPLSLCFLLLCFSASYGADFILPNSGSEPVVVDVSNLPITSGIDVVVGDFVNQPRPYRTENTKSLVIFPPSVQNSEKTIEIRAGASSVTKTVSFRSSPPGILKNSTLPDLKQARGGHTLTKLSDGRIVLVGGSTSLNRDPLSTIEIFDPNTGVTDFLQLPDASGKSSLKIPRSQHSATYLGISEAPLGEITGPVEQILIVGGFSKEGLLKKTLEIVEIKVGTNQGTSTLLSGGKSTLKKARIFHTTSLLPDGRVLIAGGLGRISMSNLGALSSIEIFDPVSRAVSTLNVSLIIPRLLHTSTTLQNGNILIAGGFTNEKQNSFGAGPGTASSELIDVTNLSIKEVGNLVNKQGLGGHTATLLTNGLVLITGGSTDFFSSRKESSLKGATKGTVQFYNPTNESFNLVQLSTGGNLELQLPRFLHDAVLLPNGLVAIIGGLNIKAANISTSVINTPVQTIEVMEPDLITFSNILKADRKSNVDLSVGRVLPRASLVTPENKTLGFLSASDLEKYLNSAVIVTGGYTNGLGKLPTKINELLQIETTNTIEGRKIKLEPEALVKGSFLSELEIKLDDFTKVPTLRTEPQTVNLSSANSFMSELKVFSSTGETILLKAESNDSVLVSPSVFQIGETVTLSIKDETVRGLFEVTIKPLDSSKDFIEAVVKVSVSDASKPYLSSVSGFGISLSTEEESSTEKVGLKVLSQDGKTEITSIPTTAMVTAEVVNPQIANLGGTGISSVVGTLQTQYTVNAIKPGKTLLNFSIDFPDVLPVTIPLEVSGKPLFSSPPFENSTISELNSKGVNITEVKTNTDKTNVSLQDVRLDLGTQIFPFYVPINLVSSFDNSALTALFTIRPIFGIDLSTARPRGLVNNKGTEFRSIVDTEPTSIGGIVPGDKSKDPLAVIASDDGIKTLSYKESTSENIDEPFNMISQLSNVSHLHLFEVGKSVKISALKGNMLFVLDSETGQEDNSITLSGESFESELIEIDGELASVVSLGTNGVDLVLGVNSSSPRVVNFKLSGDTRKMSVVKKFISGEGGPFVVVYDGTSSILIVDLKDLNAPIKLINVPESNIKKIHYAGRYVINDKVQDVLIATAQREILLFDLNNLINIPVNSKLKIKNKIEDLLVIDGIVYLALQEEGVLAIPVGSLISNVDDDYEDVTWFKKITHKVIKPSGKEEIISKPLNATRLADSKPFLLVSGKGNDLAVIKVSP